MVREKVRGAACIVVGESPGLGEGETTEKGRDGLRFDGRVGLRFVCSLSPEDAADTVESCRALEDR